MNSRTLSDLGEHITALDIHCAKCARRGRLKVSTLIARYGPEFLVPDLRTTLNADCEHANDVVNARCDLYFPQLKR